MDEAELAAREKKKQEIASVNSVQGMINDHKDATHRYTIDPLRSGREEKKTERSQNNPNYSSEGNFHVDIRTDQEFSDVPIE